MSAARDDGGWDDHDPDTGAIVDAALAALASGPRPLAELAALLATDDAFAYTADWDAEDRLDELDDVLLDAESIWTSADGLVARLDLLLDGVVLTHRLTQTEIDAGVIECGADLSALIFDISGNEVELTDGTVLRSELDLNNDWLAWPVPAAQLAGATAGELIAMRRAGSRLELLRGVTAGAGDHEAELLVAAYHRSVPAELGEETAPLLMEALLAEPERFRSPVAPLDELLVRRGFRRLGDFYGPAATAWETPGRRAVRIERERVVAMFGMRRCCEEALDQVEAAYRATVLQRGDAPPRREVIRALAHDRVAEAFVQVQRNRRTLGPRLAAFVDTLGTGRGREMAAAWFVRGRVSDAEGDPEEAARHYQTGYHLDPDYQPGTLALGWIAFERGDHERAARLFARVQARNAAALVNATAANPAAALLGKLQHYCYEAEPAERFGALLFEALEDEPDRASELGNDPMVADFALFEGLFAVGYLAIRGVLLPGEEQAMLARWVDAPRRLLEVTQVEPGTGLEVLDVRTGETFTISERSVSQSARPREYLLGRLDPDPTTASAVFVGSVGRIPMRARESALALLDGDADALDWIAWYAAVTALPTVIGPDGTVIDLTAADLAAAADHPDGLIDMDDLPDDLRAELQAWIARQEEAWIDESIPALGGMTPREAAADPTRIDDLLRLLDQPTGPGGFDNERLRRLLGLA